MRMLYNFTTLFTPGIVSNRKAMISYDASFIVIADNQENTNKWKFYFFKTDALNGDTPDVSFE